MKRWPVILLIALASTAPLAAQETNVDFSTTSPGIAPFANNTAVITKDTRLQRDDIIVGKKYTVAGFLVRPFKAIRLHKVGGAVRSVFQAINPFSREKGATEPSRFEGELSTVAWSSSVSWRSGYSGFANPVTHEMGLTALSVSR